MEDTWELFEIIFFFCNLAGNNATVFQIFCSLRLLHFLWWWSKVWWTQEVISMMILNFIVGFWLIHYDYRNGMQCSKKLQKSLSIPPILDSLPRSIIFPFDFSNWITSIIDHTTKNLFKTFDQMTHKLTTEQFFRLTFPWFLSFYVHSQHMKISILFSSKHTVKHKYLIEMCISQNSVLP
jgi:hypothetical protein